MSSLKNVTSNPSDTAWLIPDLERLRRKLDNPSPLLSKLYCRFQERLAADPVFRQYHVFLPALLGDAAAIADAKAIIRSMAADPVALAITQDNLDQHIWCIAPRAMRLAAYFSWIDRQGAWSPDERETVAADILDFFYDYVIPVLRSRVPAGHNQQLSMTFCCAMAGQVLSVIPGTAARARALRDYAMPKMQQVLGLMPRDGYSGEGSTYQSSVVAALVMWIGVFLEQLGETDAWTRSWPPVNGSLNDTLRMESEMASCGGLLPPWDHYGWAPLLHVSVRTLAARLSGRHDLLAAAETVWERWDKANYIAWRPDDQLWTLIYWPDTEPNTATDEVPTLSGWSFPSVAAATEYRPARLRVMMAWDRCAGGIQGICRAQVNPNHLMIDMDGEPVTADGWEDGSRRLFSDASEQRLRDRFSVSEKQMIEQQYGSVEKWMRGTQQGFLGAACAIIPDDGECYFPRGGRQGRQVYEQRTPSRHTVAADAAAYYRPTFDITMMRRTVSVGEGGDAWIVDDMASATDHRFTWRLWLRRTAAWDGPRRIQVKLSSGKALTLAWPDAPDDTTPDGSAALEPFPTFPGNKGGRLGWPDEGSQRCDRVASGRSVRFVTCLLPCGASGLIVARVAPNEWEARWADGTARFALPPELDATSPCEPLATADDGDAREALCDLDEVPFALLDDPDKRLLAALDAVPGEDWRYTTAVMQTLTARGVSEAMPKITALLLDARQNYTVHSVAAWCLGHARYEPARDALLRMRDIPEHNTALRAGWALERIEPPQGFQRKQ